MEKEQHHPPTSTLNQESDFPNFPQELLLEILLRLPVKSLVKFRCVSRTWLSLISSPHFIRAHLKISSNKVDFRHHGLILTVLSSAPPPPCRLKQCSLDSALDVKATTIEVIDIDHPMKSPLESAWAVGSCDGLVCIAIGEHDLFLWNPSVRKSKKLPDIGVKFNHDCYLVYDFGYDNLNDDYKVVGIFHDYCGGNAYETQVRVCSLESDSWRSIEDFKGVPLGYPVKYVNGKLHWAACLDFDSTQNWNIANLDLGNETYGEVERPECGEVVYAMTFGVAGGCLLVLCDNERTRRDVWVMKEYGVRDSWSKVASIPYLDDPAKSRYCFPVCLSRNGEILLFFDSGLVVYNPKSSTYRYLQINGLEEVNLYVESLVLPNSSGKK